MSPGISPGGLAGELGFEPRQTESESVVLPLHHSPKAIDITAFLVETFPNGFANSQDHITASVVSVQPLLNRTRNSLHLTVFVGLAALSSDTALFFPLADSDQV